MKSVLLLGASGSIGSQTLELLEENRSSFSLLGCSVGNRVQCLSSIIERFPTCKFICLKNEADLKYFQEKYPNITFFFGDEGLLDLIRSTPARLVVNALLGFAGLAPSLCALENDKVLCLANKESLVCGGHLIKKALKEHKGKLYPIDSEHVAIAKCLHETNEEVDRLLLTASGGPFYFKDVDLSKVTVEEALNHPSWVMGKKITIDSATMMNKGFEVIEASELFGFDIGKIEIVVHPESYVHSGIILKDGKCLVQVGKPDMKGPIEYALREGDVSYNDVLRLNNLNDLNYTFAKFDEKRFPAVKLCKEASKIGGAALTILNAADEEAVHLFLNKKMNFLDIVYVVRLALENISNIIREPSLDDLRRINALTSEWMKTR